VDLLKLLIFRFSQPNKKYKINDWNFGYTFNHGALKIMRGI